MTSPTITVIKRRHNGSEVWRYTGHIIERQAQYVILKALFTLDEMDLGYVTFRRGDHFIERFYADRWYALFEVHRKTDGQLLGWYCNFNRPAHISAEEIVIEDLELDLWIYPDGRTLVLDQEEFDALTIPAAERAAVLAALDAVRVMVREGQPPFRNGCAK